MKFVPLSETEKSTPEEGEPSGLTFVPLKPEAKPAPKAEAQPAPKTEAKPAPKAEAKPAPKAEAKQPAPAPAKKQPVLSEPAPSYDLMGGDLGAAIMDVAGTAKPDLGVMNDVPSQPPQKDAFLPIRPEVRQSLINAYIAGTPAERAKLERLEGVKGDVVRQFAQGFKANQAKRKKEFERRQRIGLPLFLGVEEQFDPSVEARTARLIAAGEKPEFARVAAQKSALAGVLPGQEIDYMRYEGLAEPREMDEAVAAEFEKASRVERAAAKAKAGLLESIYGVNQAVAEMVGADNFARAQGLSAKEQEKIQNSIGENPDYWKRQTENIIASTAQNAPSLALGVLTGGSSLPMAAMFVQSFGQSYAESRRRGLDPGAANARAAWMGLAEVLGEVPGFGKQLSIVRNSLKTSPLESLKQWVINTAKKEIPGEQFTLAMQTFGDIKGVSPFGLNAAPSVEQYLQMMADTLVQTVGQSALMGGSVSGASKVLQVAQDRFAPAAPAEEAIPTAEELMQQKGFITPSRKAPAKAPATEATAEAAAKPVETPAETPETKEDLAAKRQAQVNEVAADLVAMSGLDADTALKIAEGRVRAQEEQAAKEEQQRQDALQKEAAARTTLVPPAENRVQEITDELIGAGVDPTEAAQRAVAMAQQEAENDALAEQEGVTDAGEFIPTTGELGAGVSGERGVGVPAGGTTEALTAGLVPAGATTGESTEGKAVQPSTLEQAQEQVARAERELIIAQENGDLLETSRARASLMQAQNQLAEAKQQEEGAPAATKRATKTEAPAPGIRLRRPTEREKSNLSASAVIDFGTEGKAVIAEGLQDVYIRDAQGNELAVRQWDSRPGNIKVASDFPAFVPESLRQPIIDYQDAAYKNKAGTPETEAALKDARDKLQDAVADLIKQQEEQRGAKTTEAEQAEAQRAAESEAGVPPTTGKRGRPRLAPEAKLTAEDKRRQQRTAYKAIEKRLNDAERDLAESSEPVDEGEATSGEHLDEMYDNKARQRQSAINRLYDISKENRGKPGQRALELLSQNASTAEIKTAAEGYQFRKQRAAAEATSKAVEQVAAETVADEKLGRATNGAQAITQIIKTGTPFQQMLARRLRSFVNNVKIVVVEADQAVPEALTRNPRYQREWDRARALYIENYATGARTIYVRGASFGESQGVNNVTILHELVHAATNKKVELGRQAITKGTQKGTQLVRATEDLIQIMNNAGERFNELAARGELPAHISRLARFGEIFDDPREFVAYGMTDPAFQEFLRSANALGGTTSYWSMFVDALRRLIGMDPSETNALADLLDVTDTILTARPVGALDLMEGMSPMASEEQRAPVRFTDDVKRMLKEWKQTGDTADLLQKLERLSGNLETRAENIADKRVRERQRGKLWIEERLTRAERTGEITPEAHALIKWLVSRNPAVLNDLAISFRGTARGVESGSYLAAKRLAVLIRGRGNTQTVVHEILHHAERMMPESIRRGVREAWIKQLINLERYATESQNHVLMRAIDEAIDAAAGDEAALRHLGEQIASGELPKHFYQFVNPSEFWAVNASQLVANRAGAQGWVREAVQWLSEFVEKIKDIFGLDNQSAIIRGLDAVIESSGELSGSMLADVSQYPSVEGPKTEEDAAEKEEAVRTQKTIDREEDIALEKIYISEDAEETARQAGVLQAIRDPRKMLPALRSLWDSSNEKRRKLFVRMVTRDTLATWGGSYVPELLNTHDLVNDMGNLTRQLLTASADIAKAIQRAYKEDRTLPQKLSRVAYLSTLLEINPADPKAKERANKLDKMYADLGAKGQQLYQLLVQQATNIADYYSALLDQQIENAQLTPDIKSRLMVQIRQLYETRQRINPYFQLVRRGDYVLRVGQGRYRQFYTAPTLAGRDAIANKIAEQRRVSVEQLEADGDIEKINDINVIRNNALDSSPTLKKLFDLIDAEHFGDPDAKDNLKDAVYQLYLSTMPDQSFRNQFLNRKQITGFSTDLLRNFSESSTKMATQLARVKYGPLLRNSLSAAQDSISGRSDLQPFVSEMTRRVNLVLNPPAPTGVDTVVNGVNTASSVFYLSSWSSALLQPLSIFQSGYWVLGARYGYLNTGREFTKMLKIWNQYGTSRKLPDGTVAFIAPTITSAKGVTADEKMALRDMASLMESTYIGEMFRYRQTPTAELRGVYNKTKDVASIATFGLLYSTERLSREFIALSSYRLHRQMLDKAVKAGDMTAEEARKQSVKAAIRNTTDSLADYSLENRPPIMQRGAGKALLQFTMFQLHTTLFLARNFKRMTFSLASPAERWEATKIFFGVLGGTFILGGLRALPMFSIAMGILAFFWKDEDRPQELKDLDFETWWRTIHLPEMLGKVKVGGQLLSDIIDPELATKLIDRGPTNALTGWDISSRTSLNNMWLRETKEMKTLREEAVALGVEKAGPFLNMMLSYADGIEAAMDGKYEKAIEKMAPSLVRNLMTAHKYYSEGVIERHGAEVMMQGSISDLELLGQAIGFRPSILASQQEMAFKYNSIQQNIKNKRQKIMDRIGEEYMKAERTQDITEYARLLEEKEKFNLKYPSYRITKDNLKDSLKERREQRAAIQAWSGISMDKKFAPIGAESALNVTEEIAERNEQERKRREKEGK